MCRERRKETQRECTETKTERESTGETGSLSIKCNLHQKLKVPVVLGWELHAPPTKTFFYLWGKGSNIVQKYETQTDRQTDSSNSSRLRGSCCSFNGDVVRVERESSERWREVGGGGGRL